MKRSKNEEGYIVRISENALISLILNGLEAYAVFHKNITKGKRKGLETYGSIFGYETIIADGRTLYSIEFANVDTSSHQKPNEVSYNEKSIELKCETLKSFWPHIDRKEKGTGE